MPLNGYDILQTKLMPPRIKPQTVRRKRLDDLFLQVIDFPLTILQAEAGYGKSTTLVTHLCPKFDSLIWYTVDEGDRDAYLFLSYLIFACKSIHNEVGDRSLRLLQEEAFTASVIKPCLTYLLNDLTLFAPDPTVLVLDDLHTVIDLPEIRMMCDFLFRYLPAHMHIVIGTRKEIVTSTLRRLILSSDVLQFDTSHLEFTAEECKQLFQECYHIVLKTEQVESILEQTEGWAIALQLLASGIDRKQTGLLPHVEKQLDRNGIFQYIAEEVFERLPNDEQMFLTQTCILETLDPEICDQLLGRMDAKEKLEQLEKNGLFVNEVGANQFRYHRLFQEFLKQYTSDKMVKSEWIVLHKTAAQIFEQKGNIDRCLLHIDQIADLDILLQCLLQYGDNLLQNGRLELLKRYIDKIPSKLLEQNPILLFWRGEIARALSRYEEAVHWYTLAEGGYIGKEDRIGRSMVYCGHAQLYLDTIQPSKAVVWLQKAVAILGETYPQDTARILRLLTENYTNSGQLQEAEETLLRSYQLVEQTDQDELDIRIHLRSGRLIQARNLTLELLNQQSIGSREDRNRIARSHREMHLLLSLIDAFLGEVKSSQKHAEKGIEIGQELSSPFVEAIGLMRLGHALALQDEWVLALDAYSKSIQLSEQLKVDRGKVEALMGLCMTTGFMGELDQAQHYAKEGLELALSVQDVWCANLVRLAIGSIRITYGHDEEGIIWLREAARDFTVCGDPFLTANAQLWLCIAYNRLHMEVELRETVQVFLEHVDRGEVYALLQRRCLFGPKDQQMIIPFLLFARDRLRHPTAARILSELGYSTLVKHPGYTLRIYTLGTFEVYRGFERIERKEWKRDKSRQLFQFLVTRLGQWVQREEIMEQLWQETDEESAIRDFKVALHALTHAIEIEREARSESFFIERRDSSYRLVASSSIWVDAVEFRKRAERCLHTWDQEKQQDPRRPHHLESLRSELETVERQYQGDYLQHDPYLDWCNGTREHLRVLYVRCLETLAHLYMELGLWKESIAYANRILEKDGTWEEGYRIAMKGYHKLKNRNLVISTYKTCLFQLEEQFHLSPTAETIELYQRLTRA